MRHKIAEETIGIEAKKLTRFLNNKYSKINLRYKFYHNNWEYSGNLSEITFYSPYEALEFFIYKKSVTCCTSYQISIPFRGKKGGTGWKSITKYNTITSKEYDVVDIGIIRDFICKNVSDHIRKNKYKLQEE